MKTKYHVSLSVRGAIGWPDRLLKTLFRKDDGTKVTPREAKAFLMDELAQGREKIPLSSMPCEGFDYKTGCPGHRDSVGS